MDEDVTSKLTEQKAQLDRIEKAVISMRRAFLATLILSIAFIVLPLIALAFVIPTYIKSLGVGL